MIPGEASIGEVSIGGISATSNAVLGYVERLLADPDLPRRLVALPTVYNPDTPGEETDHYADGQFISEPTDTPANTYFEPRVASGFTLDNNMAGIGGVRLGGRALPRPGTLRLAIADSDLDGNLPPTRFYDDRALEIRIGAPDAPLAQFGTLFEGKMAGVRYDRLELVILLQEALGLVDKPVQTDTYAGTGGLEGGDNLEGKFKPVTLGEVYQVEPVLVDPANLIYQVHDGAISEVVAVRDNGDALTFNQDVADITATDPGIGPPVKYNTSLANGYIRLGAQTGVITVDLKGDNAGGYIDTVGAIVRRLIANVAGLTDPDDMDAAAFLEMESRAPAAVGFFAGAEREFRLPEVIDLLINSVFGYWGLRPDGRFTLGVIRPPGTEAATYTDSELIEFQFLAAAPPTKKLNFRHRPNWRVLSPTEIAGVVSDANRELFGKDYLDSETTDASVATAHPGAQELVLTSLLANTADTIVVRDRVFGLLKVFRRPARARVRDAAFARRIGESVKITSSRLGLDDRFLITGARSTSGEPSVDLTLWG